MELPEAVEIMNGIMPGASQMDQVMALRAISQRFVPQFDRREVKIPFADNRWASLTLPRPMSPDDWAYFLDVLKAMRPGLVREPVDEDALITEANPT